MFERISRSIELVKTSWRVLMEDKKLLAFPVLSGIVMLIVIATFLLPLLATGALSSATSSPAGIVLLFLFYLVSYFVVIFFNVGLISAVYARLEGRSMTVGQGLAAAAAHLGSILAWTVVAATVGLVLRLIEDRAGPAGQIAAGLVGGVWTLATMFVVPGLVFEDLGVVEAMKGSVGLVRKTWGESIVGSLSIGLVFVAVGAAGLALVLATLLLNNILVVSAAVALYIVFVAALAILASAMQGVFVVALYIYAKTGRVPAAFDRDLVEGAFAPRARQFGGNI